MKRKLLFFIFFIFIFINFTNSQLILSNKDNNKPIRLIISYPSPLIKDIIYLQNKGILNLKNLRLTILYPEKEKSPYKKIFNLIKIKKLNWINFKPIKGIVPIDSLFKKNKWTPIFYNLFKNSDGIIFPGGADIPPKIYNSKTNLLTSIKTPLRSYYEISFLYHLLGRKKDKFTPFLEKRPRYFILGICLGMQSLNVATGGSLYQDIPSEIYGLKYIEDVIKFDKNKTHKNYYKLLSNCEYIDYGNFHLINIKDNIFQFSVKNNIYVLSVHHQCVKKLGDNLKVWATSEDGKIIEGVIHCKYPNVIGVQFHPEKERLWNKRINIFICPKTKTSQFFYSHPNTLKFHKEFWKIISKKILNSVSYK